MAEAALEKRASLVSELRKVTDDKTLTSAEKRERADKLQADIAHAETEARSYVEQGERERETRSAAEKFGSLLVPNDSRRGATDIDEKRYAAGLWLSNELRTITGASGLGAALTPGGNSPSRFDRLAPVSVLIASGVNVIRTDKDALAIPRLTGDPAAAFVAEGDTIPNSDAARVTPLRQFRARSQLSRR